MEYKYKAFISYRRCGRDSIAAETLQQMLEQYVVPREDRRSPKRKLGAIFRDKTHVDTDPNLRHLINKALDASEYRELDKACGYPAYADVRPHQ